MDAALWTTALEQDPQDERSEESLTAPEPVEATDTRPE